MQTWVVDHAAPIDDGALRRIELEDPRGGRGRCWSGSAAAAYVGPISTSVKAILSRADAGSPRGTRLSVSLTRSARPQADSQSVTALV